MRPSNVSVPRSTRMSEPEKPHEEIAHEFEEQPTRSDGRPVPAADLGPVPPPGGTAGPVDAQDLADAMDALAAGEPTPEPTSEPTPPAEEPAAAPSQERLHSILESVLFASDKPLAALQLKELLGERDTEVIRAALARLVEYYAPRGLVLAEIAGGWQFRTAPENAPWVQKLLAGRPVRLSRAQLETLAIVAYRQPVTRPEIDEIRGVDSGAVLKHLL